MMRRAWPVGTSWAAYRDLSPIGEEPGAGSGDYNLDEHEGHRAPLPLAQTALQIRKDNQTQADDVFVDGTGYYSSDEDERHQVPLPPAPTRCTWTSETMPSGCLLRRRELGSRRSKKATSAL